MFFPQHTAALAKEKGTKIKDSVIQLFWSSPAKSSGRPKDNSPTCAVRTEPSHTSARSKSHIEVVSHHLTQKSARDDLPKQGAVRGSPPQLRTIRTTSFSGVDKSRARKRQSLFSRKVKSPKALDIRKEKNVEDSKNIFSYPVGGRAYEMPDEVKDELDTMAWNEGSKRLV
jgi:hypothetical protein